MAELYNTFDPNQVDPSDRFPVFPGGDYRLQLVKDEIKENQKGGSRLNMEFEILEGQFSGKRLFISLNLWANNQQAVEIAERHFSQLCHSVGYLSQVQNTEVLYGKPVYAKIGLRPAGNDKDGIWRDEQNDLKKFFPDPNYQTGNQGAGSQHQGQQHIQTHQNTGHGGQNQSNAGNQGGGAPWQR